MKLSVAIATHNEEKNIIRTIESVYEWVDEIVVADGESTDKTVDVIKKFDRDHKIQVFAEPNRAMFHENKQIAIAKCKGEWILQLDADEVVSVELKNEILNSASRRIQDDSEGVVAYWIPRLNFFLGKPLRKGGQYPDYTIRLYKNGMAHFPCKSVHEQVEIKGQIDHLKTDLLHYPYPTFESYLEKWIRYGVLEAEVWRKYGIKPSFANSIKYMIVLPKWWFFKTYIRHRGYADGFPGFVFSLFSAIRYWVSYVKLCETKE